MAAHLRVVGSLCAGLLAVSLAVACGDSSGPSDTTITLNVDPVTSPTNQASQDISGIVDGGSQLTVTGPVDTVTATATAAPFGGTVNFSLTLDLAANLSNVIDVMAVDPAGNADTVTVAILHDNIAPTLSFTSPTQAGATGGQSGFDVTLSFADESSGVDASSFNLDNDASIGGEFRQDGTFSTTLTAGTNLVPLFASVTAAGASLTVPDSALFNAGANRLTANIADAAGNTSADAKVDFTVTSDPDKFIVVNSAGTAGSSGNAVVIGLANAGTIAGLQFDLAYDPAVVASVDSVTLGDRATSFDNTAFNEIMPGQVRVLLFDAGADVLPPGRGPVLLLWLTLDAAAPSGDATLTVEAILVSDSGGATSGVSDATGTLTVS